MTRRLALRLFALLWAGAIVLGAVSLFARAQRTDLGTDLQVGDVLHGPQMDVNGRLIYAEPMRPIRIGTNWNHKCPVCQLEGRLSTVTIGSAESTLLSPEPYYDEHGRFHVHDPNVTTVTYRCSHGHPFYQLHQSPCPFGDWPEP